MQREPTALSAVLSDLPPTHEQTTETLIQDLGPFSPGWVVERKLQPSQTAPT